MKIKHTDITIPEANPFENCKLGRKQYADVLTGIISSYADGFVLAINNEWGTGKTTFVKMWQQQLKNAGYKTLYFNAWENDFDSNPLVAIMSELKTIISPSNEELYKSLLKKGAIITKHILPSLLKAFAEHYIDTKAFTEAIENITEAATDILKDEIDEYAKKKQGLIEFRAELEKFIKKNNNDKPLVFIIDELDRCRPNYAVEVLEQVKHFFSVPGIVFVLSIDKQQLGNAMKGVYGSEELNVKEYLRRFIDLEYVLPNPNADVFCNYLYDYFGFQDFFNSPARMQSGELMEDKNSFLKIAADLFKGSNTTLRQQEKIFSHARVVLSSFKENSYVFPTLFLLLIYIRDFNSDFYNGIVNRKYPPQELLQKIETFFPNNIDQYNLRFYISTEALLMEMYDNYCFEIDHKSKLWVKNIDTGESEILIESGIDKNNTLPELVNNVKRKFDNISLQYLLKKINLMENISIG